MRFWQGWAFIVVFGVCEIALAVDIARTNPALLQRRMKMGPNAETRPVQKIVMAFVVPLSLLFAALPGIDHRFAWSHVPPSAVIAGDVLVVLGFWLSFAVFNVNSYGSAVIEVGAAQTVVSTGPYRYVRHPMYAGAIILLFGVPPALGSLWGLVLWLAIVVCVIVRLIDEEQFLDENLAGYDAYRRHVRYRLVPGIF